MALYKVECTIGFVGCDETVTVDADSAEEAEQIALEYWNDVVQLAVFVHGEILEDDASGYAHIN